MVGGRESMHVRQGGHIDIAAIATIKEQPGHHAQACDLVDDSFRLQRDEASVSNYDMVK